VNKDHRAGQSVVATQLSLRGQRKDRSFFAAFLQELARALLVDQDNGHSDFAVSAA
jgi:hypothetical protein